MIFKSKRRELQNQISLYCQELHRCLEILQASLGEYCENPDREVLKANTIKIHEVESLADDICGEIEVMMYSKAIFPESRGDILGLLETMDRVPNQAESALRMILNQYIEIPREYNKKILQLTDTCCRAAEAMRTAGEKLFSDYTTATVVIGKIDELESEADKIEANLIEKIFASDMDGFKKIMLRDLVKSIAQIADRAENVGDRIRIIVAKRSI